MTHDVRTTRRAEGDVEEMYRWIAEHDVRPLGARRWVDGLQAAIASLREHPLRCPRARESSFLERDIRQLLYRKHRILFVVEGEEVLVLHIRHGSRLPATPGEIDAALREHRGRTGEE